MMLRNAVICAIVFLSMSCQTAPATKVKHNYILFYKPNTNSEENNFYDRDSLKLNRKRQYTNLKKAHVEADLNRVLKHNDHRFISISGNSYLFPGLEGEEIDGNGNSAFEYVAKGNQAYLDKFGSKVIDGTSDSHPVGEPVMQLVAYNYAKKYNLMLLKKIKLLKE